MAATLTELERIRIDPVYFMENYYHINHPVYCQTLLKLNQQQKDAVAAIHAGKDSMILGSRQVGKSTIVSAYLLWTAIFNPHSNILIASTTLNSATRVMDKIRFAYHLLPDFIKPRTMYDKKLQMEFRNGSRIRATAATEKLGRGIAISILFIDEMAFIDDTTKRLVMETLLPCILTGTRFIAASTPNGHEMFYQLWEDAANGNGMTAIKLLATDDSPKDVAYFKDMRAIMSERSFRQEILCEFIKSE